MFAKIITFTDLMGNKSSAVQSCSGDDIDAIDIGTETLGDCAVANGKIVVEPLKNIKAEKRHEIILSFEHAVSLLEGEYSQKEVSSWTKQEAEARAFKIDPMGEYPMLNSIAGAKQMSIDQLATNIIANSDAFVAVYGAVLAKKQLLFDAILAAGTQQEVEAIAW